MGGDYMLQEQIIEVAALNADEGDPASGWRWLLHAVQPVLDEYRERGETAVVVNLESPVATERRTPQSSNPPIFNGPFAALEGIKGAGVGYVTLSNNHAFDQKRAGLGETVEAAGKAGLGVAGASAVSEEAARAPLLLGGGASGVEVALLSYLVRTSGKKEPKKGPAIALFDGRSAGEVAAAAAAPGVAGVVVALHWIGEFHEKPTAAVTKAVEALVAAGADAVVCHGPHVVGPAGMVTAGGRTAFVAWSVGNLVANFGWEVYPGAPLAEGKTSAQRLRARYEALAALEFGADGLVKATMHPLWLEDNRFASLRKGGEKRKIFPMPVPTCIPMDKVGCPKGGKWKECAQRWEMIRAAGDYMIKKLWKKPKAAITTCGKIYTQTELPFYSIEFMK